MLFPTYLRPDKALSADQTVFSKQITSSPVWNQDYFLVDDRDELIGSHCYYLGGATRGRTALVSGYWSQWSGTKLWIEESGSTLRGDKSWVGISMGFFFLLRNREDAEKSGDAAPLEIRSFFRPG